jgi:hypothetical protein
LRSGVEGAPEWFVPPEPMLTGVRAQMAEQSGVLSRRQALAGGLTEGEIRARVASGRWQRVHPGVFAVHGGVLSRSARLWAALLYAGEGAALSHQTAAEVLGFRGRPDPLIHVTIPSARRVRKQPGLVIHRADRSVARVPLPVVSAAETVLDLTDVATCLDDVLGWVTRGCAFRTARTRCGGPWRAATGCDGDGICAWRSATWRTARCRYWNYGTYATLSAGTGCRVPSGSARRGAMANRTCSTRSTA